MKKPDLEHWNRLSPLLDVALDLDADARDAWLETLPPEVEDLKPQLRRLLALPQPVETWQFAGLAPIGRVLLGDPGRDALVADHLREGGEIAGYRLLRELGRGGMGSVWLAERMDGTLKRQVALKFPYGGPNSKLLAERLGREREILSSLEHVNVARLYDAGMTEDGAPFLVLEYVDGIPIDLYCDRHRLTTRQRIALFLQVLGAVQYAHTHLVIHRDLKPSNILVTGDGIVRLLDFGIAKLISEGRTDTAATQIGPRALTPDYASPEQITGKTISTASDVYSLGVVLYQLLTGSRPYRLKRDSPASLEEAIAEALVVPPSRAVTGEAATLRQETRRNLVNRLRGDLDTILAKALDKRIDERYATADAFSRDLQRSLNDEPVEARPHSTAYLLRKLFLRHRLAASALAVVVLALSIGVGVASWQAGRARASEKRAVAAAATSEAVKQFMIRIFSTNTLSQSDPAKARQTNALQLLEAGAARVDVEFAKDPMLRKEMLLVIVPLLAESQSGEYEKYALELIGILKSDVGKDLEVATIFSELSALKIDDSAMSAAYAQAGLKALGPDVDAAHRQLHGNLLYAYAHARQNIDSLDATAAMLEEARNLLRRDSANTAEYGRVLEELGWVELRRNHNADGVAYFEQSLKAHLADPTVYQHSIARVRYSLAIGNVALKRYSVAEQQMREASAIFERSFGVTDSQTAFNNAALGRILALERRFDEALAVLKPAVAALEAKTPRFSARYLAGGVEFLATTLVWAGRMGEADGVVKRMADMIPMSSVRDRPRPLMIESEYDVMRGRWSKAEAAARSAVQAAVDAYGPTNQKTSWYKNVLARVLIDTGKWREAGLLLTANIQEDGQEPRAFNSVSTDARVQRARLLVAHGRGEDAVPDLRLLQRAFLAQPPNQQTAMDEVELRETLGDALLAAGRPDEALPALDRALDLRRSEFERSPRLGLAQTRLARCKLVLGDVAGARSLLDKAKAIYAANLELGPQYWGPFRSANEDLAKRSP